MTKKIIIINDKENNSQELNENNKIGNENSNKEGLGLEENINVEENQNKNDDNDEIERESKEENNNKIINEEDKESDNNKENENNNSQGKENMNEDNQNISNNDNNEEINEDNNNDINKKNISQENIENDISLDENNNNEDIDENEKEESENNNEELNENEKEEVENIDNINKEELNENENEEEEEDEENNENNEEEEEIEEEEDKEDKEIIKVNNNIDNSKDEFKINKKINKEKENNNNIITNNNEPKMDKIQIMYISNENTKEENKNNIDKIKIEEKNKNNIDKIKIKNKNNIDKIKLEETNDIDRIKLEDKNNIDKIKLEDKNNIDKIKIEEENNIDKIKLEDKNNIDKIKFEEANNIDKIKFEEANNIDKIKIEEENNIDKIKIKEENKKEEEIQIKIVEYNRKGKIIKNSIQMIEGNNILINEIKNYQNLEKDETFLYIEILPLILADFLQENKNYAIIEMENEISKDLYMRFDKDLLNIINEYNELKKSGNISNIVIKSKELEIAIKEYNKIKKNIKMFKVILKKKKKLNEKSEYIENTIEKLVSKEVYLEHKIKILNEKQSLTLLEKIKGMNKEYSKFNNKRVSRNMNSQQNLKVFNSIDTSKLSLFNSHDSINSDRKNIKNFFSNNFKFINITNKINSILSKQNTNFDNNKNEKINKALKEIFYFYSKKHNIVGHSLFSKIEEKKKRIDLHEFSLFCSEFKIPIPRQKIVEIFKKNVSDCQLMEFKEFKISLSAIANAMFESKKQLMKNKILMKNNKIKQLELKENQENEEENLKIIFRKELRENNKIMKFSSSYKNNKEKRTKYFLNQKNKLKNEILDIKNNYNNSLTKSNKKLLEEFYDYLNITTNEKNYRLKMRGFNSSPLILNNLNNNEKIKNELDKNNENEKINLNRIKINEIRNKIRPNLKFDKNKIFKINKRLKSNDKNILKNNSIKSTKIAKDKKNQISWSKLKNYNINDLNLNEKEKSIFLELDNINDNCNNQKLNIITNDNKNNLNNDKVKENSIKKDIGIKKLKLIKNNSLNNINYKNRYFKLKNDIVLPPIINNSNYLAKNKYTLKKN